MMLYDLLGDELQEKVRRWLSPPDPSINHNTARDAHRGKREMVRPRDTFQHGNGDWVTPMGYGTCAILLLYSLLGLRSYFIAGSGKSILSYVLFTLSLFSMTDASSSSSIIEDLKKSRKADWHRLFLLFRLQRRVKEECLCALSSLLVQLAAHRIVIQKYSLPILGTWRWLHPATDEELRESFKNMLAVPDQAPYTSWSTHLMSVRIARHTITRENVLRSWVLLNCPVQICGNRHDPTEPDIALFYSIAFIPFPFTTNRTEETSQNINWFVNSDPKARKWRNKTKNSLSRSCQRELMACKPLSSVPVYFELRWWCSSDGILPIGQITTMYRITIRHALDNYGDIGRDIRTHIIGHRQENWLCASSVSMPCGHTPSTLCRGACGVLAFEFEEGGHQYFKQIAALQTKRRVSYML